MLKRFIVRMWAPLLAAFVVTAMVTTAFVANDRNEVSLASASDVLQPPDSWQFWKQGGFANVPLLGDVNGDGKKDMIIPVTGGDVYVGISLGFQFAAPAKWLSGFCTILCQTGDVDGDGKADLVSYAWGDGKTDGSANVTVARSTGLGFTPSAVWNDGFCIREQVCQLADVDGDKRADLVAFTPYTGLVWVSKSTGSAFGANAVLNNYFCVLGERCQVGDVDGDGKADLILFKPGATGNQKGNVLWARSTGSGFEAAKYGHGYFCVDNETCSVGDFNGDGKADIMLVKQIPGKTTLELLVSLSDGQKFVNPNPVSWSTAVPGFFAAAGDVDGDSKADVLSYVRTNGSNDVSFYVTPSKAKPPVTTPPTTTPPASGISRLEISNCTVEHRDLYMWVYDAATKALVINSGPVEPRYNNSGTCPAVGDPWDFNPDAGRTYDVVAVDPDLIGCGSVNDPSVHACIKQSFRIRGNNSGPVWKVIIPAA